MERPLSTVPKFKGGEATVRKVRENIDYSKTFVLYYYICALLLHLEDKLQEMVPPPLHSAMEKQDPQEAKTKYHERQQKQVELVPPTCTGKLL